MKTLYQSRFGGATEDYILALAVKSTRSRFLGLREAALFAPSSFAQAVSQFFVNLSPVADREYPNEPGFAIDFID
jgi:hypothetical protein